MTDFDERAAFVALVQRFGIRRLRPERVVAPVGPDGDCWTYAWAYAREHGYRYVEGSVRLDDGEGQTAFVRAHAWAEEDATTGVVVHEVTEGYETAFDYIGLNVACSPNGYAELVTAEWDGGLRGSVIEALIVTGFGPTDILVRTADA